MTDELLEKVELSGEGKPWVELMEDVELREFEDTSGPLEAHAAIVHVELESDWTGWEASAILEAQLSRPTPGILRTIEHRAGHRLSLRDSIQQTPTDMIGNAL